jgi:AcrR family transcriptional regulator
MPDVQPELAVVATGTWVQRAADRSPSVQRSRTRSMARAQQIVQAARRLIDSNGTAFTTHDLVKEAGVAIKTFYKHFGSKDQVLLAVLEDMIAEGCATFAAQASELPDPMTRLRFYVTAVIAGLDRDDGAVTGPRFITSEHWRLQQLYPEEVALASRPFTDLLVPEIRTAAEAGLLQPNDVDYDAWLVNQLAMAVYHHYAFSTSPEPHEQVADRLWSFCLAALGGRSEETR